MPADTDRYGTAHRALRRDYQRRMNQGAVFTCWRCGEDINPEHWHLGHKDGSERDEYAGPECPPCNTATNTHKAAAKKRPTEQHPGLIGG